jgi:glycosyltransferase involved in cell wall biosynthesis
VRRCLQIFSAPDGGVPEHVMRLAMGLGQRGWEPWLAGPEWASIYEPLTSAGISVTRLPFRPGYRSAFEDRRVLHALISLMRRHRFDLVNTHGAKEGVLGRLAAAATGTPVVATQHGWSFDPAFRRGPGRALSLCVEHMLAPHTRGYICVADSVRRMGLDHRLAPASAFHTVHNGAAACDGRSPRDPELERFAREGPVAGCVTVLRPVKCVDVFLKAAPRVLEEVPEARLAVVGNGPTRGELERHAKALDLHDRLRFFDFTPPSARQLRSLDVFVLASRWEAFPISLLEAMACGVPPVATDVGGTHEAVCDGESGLLCPPGSPSRLAEAIVRLLADPERRIRMGRASRERFHRYFTIERMLDRTAAAFDRALAGSGGMRAPSTRKDGKPW